METVPAVGSSRWLMHRIKVDFPEPEGPMMTSFSAFLYSQINIFQDLQVTEILFQMFDFYHVSHIIHLPELPVDPAPSGPF